MCLKGVIESIVIGQMICMGGRSFSNRSVGRRVGEEGCVHVGTGTG